MDFQVKIHDMQMIICKEMKTEVISPLKETDKQSLCIITEGFQFNFSPFLTL